MLTDLLTTTLDYPGRVRNEKPGRLSDGLGAAGQGRRQAGADGPGEGAGRRRAAARRVREITRRLRTRGKLSREESTAVIRRVTGELADLPEKTVAAAAPERAGGHHRARRRDRGAVPVPAGRDDAGQRDPAGQPARPDARPIRKGRIDRPVEFGYKAQVTDNDDGIVPDCKVEYGAAPDGPQFAPAVERIARRAGQVPRAATADRGYGLPAVERDLRGLGIRIVAIPRQAATCQARKAVGHGRPFRQLVKWRTGCEGRLSYLKRATAGTAPSWTAGTEPRSGADTGFARNLVKISALTA